MRRATAALVGLVLIIAACGSPASPAPAQSATTGTPPAQLTGTLHLGYYPNITHASALIGIEAGIFRDALGPGVTLEPSSFNAGPAATEALLSGAIDITYVGPNPAINAYAKSGGAGIRIIAGATSGGAFLVVRKGIASAADLRGTKLATPQLGNTQDVALRTWLSANGLTADTRGGGDVSILPQDNAQTLQTFTSGAIDGAWVPEPWATRLVKEGGGTVLVDERTLWPEGHYVTTLLVARTDFLKAQPDLVRALLVGHLRATDLASSDAVRARELTNSGIEKVTGKRISEATLEAAWPSLTFTVDPIASSLAASADHAVKLGLLQPVDLAGIFDLSILNDLLSAAGKPKVTTTP